MATDPVSTISTAEALAALAPLIGGAGISGILVAVFGYLKAAREGRTPALDPGAQMGLATLYTDRAALKEASQAVEGLVAVLAALARAVDGLDGQKFETLIDELRHLRRAIEDSCRGDRRR